MPNITRAFIVTDPGMVSLGYVDKILYYLRKRTEHVHCEIFSDVEPDPSIETVKRGAQMMDEFKPDVIIALGGGSAMDAAKGMWLFYEHPDVDFNSLRLRFLDIRKRAFKFPKMGNKAQLVAIPTTSGTGSEVTSFAVISDKKNNMKYPLADYELTPNIAIIDPQFVMSLPKSATADTGLDVLTHALEAYVSVMASDYTDGLAMKAIQLVFKYLPRAYKNGAEDAEAREKNAQCKLYGRYGICKRFPWTEPLYGSQTWCVPSHSTWCGKCASFDKRDPLQCCGSTGEDGNFLTVPVSARSGKIC